MKYPRKTLSHEIARKAENIFEQKLIKDSWHPIKVPLEYDFGIDYRVELTEEEGIKGMDFYVQLKGFEKIDETKPEIPIKISVSTLNYWKGKLIPILLVAVDCSKEKAFFQWFEKGFEIKQAQQTQVINIPLKSELFTRKIRTYLEAYYKGFTESLQNHKKLGSLKYVFNNSIMMSETAIKSLMALMFGIPHHSKEEMDSYTADILRRFMIIFSSFVNELNELDIRLDENKFEESLNMLLNKIKNIFAEICCPVTDKEAFSVLLLNDRKALNYLPTLTNIFCEINRELCSYLMK